MYIPAAIVDELQLVEAVDDVGVRVCGLLRCGGQNSPVFSA